MRRWLTHPVARASLLRIVAVVVGVAGSVVIARFGGAEVKGVASAFAGANAIAATLIGFDLAHQALRVSRESGELQAVGHAVRRAAAAYVLVAGAVGMVALAFSADAAWLVVGAVAFTISNHFAVAATGVRGASVAAWGALSQQVSMLLGGTLLGVSGLLTIETVRYVVVISYLVPLVYFAWHLRADRGVRLTLSVSEQWAMLRAGAVWQLARIPQMLLLRLDVIVVFAVLGATVAGLYSVGLSLAMLCTLVPAQFAAFSLNRATTGRPVQANKQIARAAVVGLASALLLAAAGQPAIVLLYGSDFADSYPVMLACLLGATAYGVMQVQSNFIRLLGTGRQLVFTNLVGLSVMVISLAILIPIGGGAGAGLAFSLGTVATAMTTHVVCRDIFRRPAQP